MLKKILQIIFKILHILFVILTFGLIIISIFRKDLIENIIVWFEWMVMIMWFYNYIIALFSSILETMPLIGILLPGQNIMLAVGWFFGKTNTLNLLKIIWVASLWALIWNHIWYLMWKKYWDSFFEKYWIRFGIWKTEVEYIKKWINKWGWFLIAMWKFHPMTRSFLPFIAGSMWMHNKKFFLFNIIWSIVRATTIITLWVVFAHFYEILIQHSGKISIMIMILLSSYIYFFKKEEFKKYLQEKNKELDNL